MKSKTIKVYTCGVDWQHEIGHASGGNAVYPSVADLKKHRPCHKRCGIVELKLTLSKWIEEQSDLTSSHPEDYLSIDEFEFVRREQIKIFATIQKRRAERERAGIAAAERYGREVGPPPQSKLRRKKR